MAALNDDHIIVASDKKWKRTADAAPRRLYLSASKSCTNCWKNVAGPTDLLK